MPINCSYSYFFFNHKQNIKNCFMLPSIRMLLVYGVMMGVVLNKNFQDNILETNIQTYIFAITLFFFNIQKKPLKILFNKNQNSREKRTYMISRSNVPDVQKLTPQATLIRSLRLIGHYSIEGSEKPSSKNINPH